MASLQVFSSRIKSLVRVRYTHHKTKLYARATRATTETESRHDQQLELEPN
jgi:hypothetical protein